jgi:hypothetical protein
MGTLRHPGSKGEGTAIGGVEDLDLVMIEPDSGHCAP